MLPEAGVIIAGTDLAIQAVEGRVFGWQQSPAPALLGRHLKECLPVAAWEQLRPHWEAALLGASRTIDWTAPDGGRSYWVRFAPVFLPGADIASGALMVAQDVTEKITAQRDLERRVLQQQAVTRLGTMVLHGLAFADVATAAAAVLESTLGATTTAVLEEVPGEGLRLQAVAGEEMPPPPPAQPGQPPRIFDFVRDANQSLLIDELGADPLLRAPVLEGLGMRSLVVAPIASVSSRFGLVGAAGREPCAFSQQDLSFVQAIANLLAYSIERERGIERTARAESRLAEFWEVSNDLLGIFTPEGVFVEASGGWERRLGWTADELIGTSALDLLHPDDRAEVAADVEERLRAQDRPEVTNRLRARDGTYRWLLWSVRRGADGLLYSAGKDITNRRLLEDRARHREMLLEAAERQADLGSWEIEFATGECELSKNMRELLMIDAERVPNRVVRERVHPDDRDVVDGAVAAAAVGANETPADFRVLLPDGAVRIMSVTVELVWGEDRLPTGMRGTAQDITERRTSEQHLLDSEERFRQGFDHAPIAMSLIGAATGRYLRVNAAFCDLVGRTEEQVLGCSFTQLLHPDDVDRAERRLLQEGGKDAMVLEKRYIRPDGTVVWGSIHVSRVVRDEGGVDVLFAQTVDVTERHAQEDALRRQMSEISWIGEIRAALNEDRFELHAQPIIDLTTGATLHSELLLRMRDRDGQLVAPDAFLPTAERYGDICAIDRWVISRGLELAATGMSVAINISGPSMDDPGLIAHIDGELERTGAPPARVVFEITETALVKSGEAAIELSRSLRDRGCRFALDDFGTGYGGFHYLKTLPLDILKIDREFVRELVDVESDRHLIWATVNLASRFNLATVAEGVEDLQTLELLREMGVDQAQGFHIARPEPVALPNRRP